MDEGPGTCGLARALLITATLLLVASCSLLRGDPVQEQWRERPALPSCGEFTLEVDEQLETSSRAEVACLVDAWAAGDGAELLVRSSTVEGDPIIEYYRVVPGGGAEVFIDATQDKFGSERWEFSRCDTPTSALDVNC